MEKKDKKIEYKVVKQKLETAITSDETCMRARKLVKKWGTVVFVINIIMAIGIVVATFGSGALFPTEFKYKVVVMIPFALLFIWMMLYGIYRTGGKFGSVVILLQGVYGIMESLKVIKSYGNSISQFIGWSTLASGIVFAAVGILFLTSGDIKYLNEFIRTEAEIIKEETTEEI